MLFVKSSLKKFLSLFFPFGTPPMNGPRWWTSKDGYSKMKAYFISKNLHYMQTTMVVAKLKTIITYAFEL
jgi:hypothetical protein